MQFNRRQPNANANLYEKLNMLTEAPRFLPAPVGGAGIPAGQHAEALQPVASQAGEEGLATRVEPAN